MRVNIKEEIVNFFDKGDLHNPKILDLGFGNTDLFFHLIREIRCKLNRDLYYVGVDMLDDYNIYNDNNTQEIQPIEYKIEPEAWFHKFNNKLEVEDNCKINEEEFLKCFEFYFETDIIDFIKNISHDKKYNAIILSNVLHKLSHSDSEKVFDKCLTLMEENSIIYVSVLGSEYTDFLEEDKLYSMERYLNLKSKVDVISSYENIQYHLSFIGRKIK